MANPNNGYLIWSYEHDAWWAPNERGYTRDIKEAGWYSEGRAREIVTKANRYLLREEMNEAMIPAWAVAMEKGECDHMWDEQPGEPPFDVCMWCGERRY